MALGQMTYAPSGGRPFMPRPRADAFTPKAEQRQAIQELERAWLQELVRLTGKSLAQIAGEAGLSSTALSRMFRDGYTGTLSALTKAQLREYLGTPSPEQWEAQGRPPLSNEFEESSPWLPEADANAHRIKAVGELLAGRPGAEAWILRTRALEDAGLLPGDIVIIEPGEPRDRDLVCASIQDARPVMVWRRYDRPYLTDLSRNADMRTAPELVDGKRVRIRGIVRDLVRSR
jgi:AraC-like DNA-binding protein